MENPYAPPNVQLSVSPTSHEALPIIRWRSVIVATLVDGGTMTGIWACGMINRLLYGMRYVLYTKKLEYEMIVWTIVRAIPSVIPAVVAATYVVHKSKQSGFLSLLVYGIFRTIIVAGLSLEIILYLDLQNYFMYIIYVGLIGLLGRGFRG